MSIATITNGLSFRSFRVWQRNCDVYLRLWRSEAVWPLVEPVVSLLALGVGLGGLIDLGSDQRYIEFIAFLRSIRCGRP